jgi:hypothetical protein
MNSPAILPISASAGQQRHHRRLQLHAQSAGQRVQTVFGDAPHVRILGVPQCGLQAGDLRVDEVVTVAQPLDGATQRLVRGDLFFLEIVIGIDDNTKHLPDPRVLAGSVGHVVPNRNDRRRR